MKVAIYRTKWSGKDYDYLPAILCDHFLLVFGSLWGEVFKRTNLQSREAVIYQHRYFSHIGEGVVADCPRVAEVGGLRDRRSTTGQGLLRQKGPPTYAILSRNSILSRFTRFLKGFRRALNESHPAFVEHSTKAILLS